MLRADLRPALSEGPAPSGGPRLERATGRLELAVGLRDGASGLLLHREEGSAKARFPRQAPNGPLEAVLSNTAGGLAGGDRLDQRLAVGPGAALLAVGQAAEKVYRSLGPDAVVRTRLEVAAGGTLLWLPQETILFDGGRLDRALEAELAGDARLLLVEAVVLGRTARGERVHGGRLRERRTIRIDGRLVWCEPFRLDGPIEALAERPALLGGARAFATLLALGPEVETLVEPLRARLEGGSVRAAAGFRAPCLVTRLLAPDGFELRRALAPAVTLLAGALGGRAELPRVWRC